MRQSKGTSQSSLLNVHAFLPVSYANGPGARAVVWTQGCSLRCPGCSNPLTHSHKRRILINPLQLAKYILAIPGLQGLTVSGGEPFEQALAVERLCGAVRKDGLSVMVFTGWTYESICRCRYRAVKDLLKQIDILVDGPFIQEMADRNLAWRGSRNQRVIFLTDRYGPDVLRGSVKPQVEGKLSSSGSFRITGFPEASDLDLLTKLLASEFGILLRSFSKN